MQIFSISSSLLEEYIVKLLFNYLFYLIISRTNLEGQNLILKQLNQIGAASSKSKNILILFSIYFRITVINSHPKVYFRLIVSIIDFIIIMQQNSKQSNPKSRETSSKQTLYSLQKHHNEQSLVHSKKTLSQIQPRITRRMKKMANSSSSGQEKCAICLGDCQKDFGKLTCSHIFCLECVIKWWRDHPTCPYCREKIDFITTNEKKIIRFEDLEWEVVEDDDQNFIPHCELCWGEIEPFESMNICTECRAVYWHSNCLPFSNNQWYCVECANKNDEEHQND